MKKLIYLITFVSTIALAASQTVELGPTVGGGGSGTTSPLTTKGDVWGYDTTNARIPIGTNGQVLTADSTQALGLKWGTVTGTGTVTSVDASVPAYMSIAGNPITGAGTLAFDFISETQNKVFSSPNGSSGTPTFRALVSADIPALSYVSSVTGTAPVVSSGGLTPAISMAASTNAVDGYLTAADHTTFAAKQAAGNYITALTGDATAAGPGSAALTLATVNGNVGSFTNANITVNAKGLITAASNGSGGGGSGTVTSVDASVPSFLTISGNPITTSGTLAIDLATQTANTIFAGPVAAGPSQPTFRSMTANDLPNTAVTPGSYTLSNITVDQKGRISTASSTATGNLTDAGTDGITVTSGTGAVIGAGTSLSQHVADSTHNGYLSQTDWSTFNGKQAAGNYITALTGDVTAAGPGSSAASLVAITNSTLTTLISLSLPSTQVTSSNDSVSYFNGSGLLTSDSAVEYSPSNIQTFPPFSAHGFYAKSDIINSATSGLVIGSLDTSTDSFTTNLGMITGANLGAAAANDTGGVLFGTGEVIDVASSADSGAVNVFTGGNGGTGASGGITISSGQTTSGPSGALNIASGESTSGNSGSVNISTGQSLGGSSGDLKMTAGPSDGTAFSGETSLSTAAVSAVGATADSGVVQVESGPILDSTATGGSGALTMKSGDNMGLGTTGNIQSSSGAISNAADAANTGSIFSFSGSNAGTGSSGGVVFASGNTQSGNSGFAGFATGDAQSGNSGDASIKTGQVQGVAATSKTGDLSLNTGSVTDAGSSGNTGEVFIATGDNSGSGNSGNVTLSLGSIAGGTRGKFRIQDGTEGTSGYCWTSTDTSGSGSWQACSGGGGGANVTLSNLTTTNINASLIPDGDATRDLGTQADRWGNVYAANMIDNTGNNEMDLVDRLMKDTTSTTSLDWANRILYDSTSALALSWGVTDNLTFNSAHTIYTASSTAPAVSACGVSPSITGTDSSGTVTVGTGGLVSSCTVTFGTTWASTPRCFLNDETAIVVTKAVASTTVLTITTSAPFAASSVIDYHCESN